MTKSKHDAMVKFLLENYSYVGLDGEVIRARSEVLYEIPVNGVNKIIIPDIIFDLDIEGIEAIVALEYKCNDRRRGRTMKQVDKYKKFLSIHYGMPVPVIYAFGDIKVGTFNYEEF